MRIKNKNQSFYSEVSIIEETSDFVVLNKPAGLLTHRLPGKEEAALTDWLLTRYPEMARVGDPSTSSGRANLRPGIVHRLDRNTSGIIAVARNQDFFLYLKNLFQNRQVEKVYWALVRGRLEPSQGIIDKPIGLKNGTIKRTIHGGKMIKPAVTEYRVIERWLEFSLVELRPKTGRTHQLRVHLAAIGHPIAGDPLYGKNVGPYGLRHQFLHAHSLEFALLGGSRRRFEADLPADLRAILDDLRQKAL